MAKTDIEPSHSRERSLTDPRHWWIVTTVTLIGFAFLIVGVWAWRDASTRPVLGDGVIFEPTTQDVGVVFAGESRFVSFRISNPPGLPPARLLGAESHCNLDGCVFWRGDPLTIPSGGSATIEVEWKGNKPGRLVQELPVYMDRQGQSIVLLTIAGEVVDEQPTTAAGHP